MIRAVRSLAMLVVACVASLLVAAECQRPAQPEVGGGPSTGWGGGVNTGGEAPFPPPPPPSSKVCRWVPSGRAVRRGQARVVGGSPSALGAYPWTCSVETADGAHYCGATVVRPMAALCAAHCQVQPGDVLHCGTVDLTHPGQRIRIAEPRNNPTWSGVGTMGDVAVLMLESSTTMPPVELSDRDVHADYPIALVAIGWGAIREGGQVTPIQQHVTLPLVPWDECDREFEHRLTGDMLCAGGIPGQDACQGDSGGPLVVQTGSGWAQVGIVSWGHGCARDLPGVYTSVYQWRDWILACSEP